MPAKVQETIAKLLERVVVPPEQDAVVWMLCGVCSWNRVDKSDGEGDGEEDDDDAA